MSQDAPVLAATTDNFDQLVLENSRKGPVLVDFWASWAGSSLRQRELLQRLAAEQAEPVERLDAALARTPADSEVRFTRAAVAVMRDDFDAALEHLAEIQRLDADFRQGLVRQALLVVLDLLGPDDERTRRFRQSLFQH